MTVIFALFGLLVFIISLLTVGFTAAFKRFLMFVLAGFSIDVLIASFVFIVGCLTL